MPRTSSITDMNLHDDIRPSHPSSNLAITPAMQPLVRSQSSLSQAYLVQASHSRQSGPIALAAPLPSHWLRSSRNLDFCALAVCSCVLTLLCHQTGSVVSGRAVQPTAPAAQSPLSIDYAIKTGLFTQRSADETWQQQAAQD